jgi:cytochrome c-type biogenesis protein CcmI
MHLEAFELAAGEPVELALERLPARRPAPPVARAAFAVLLAALSAAFLIGPLRSARAEAPGVSPQAARAAAERESVHAALRDLDEDFATGKLDAADHAQLRAELRAEAARLLQAERAPAPPPPAAGPARCPSCDAETGPGARFCARCGARLAAQADAAGGGAG